MVQLLAFLVYLVIAVGFMKDIGSVQPALTINWWHFMGFTTLYWVPFAYGFIAGRLSK